MQQTTETLRPVVPTTDKLLSMDRQTEQVARIFYLACVSYNFAHPGMLRSTASRAILALHAALRKHDLTEQIVCLQRAVLALQAAPLVAMHPTIATAIALATRFLDGEL